MSNAAPIITAAATLVGAAASGYGMVAGSKTPKAPKAPTVTPPAVMPTMDDNAVNAARKKEILMRQRSSGRASTNLVNETLG